MLWKQSVVQRKVFPEGAVIFSQGEAAHVAYVIQDGEVEISAVIEEKRKVLGTIGTNALFGEMALVDDSPRMATAKTLVPTTVLQVTREEFNDRMKRTDPLIAAIVRILTQQIRSGYGLQEKPELPSHDDLALPPQSQWFKGAEHKNERLCLIDDLNPGMKLTRPCRDINGRVRAAKGQVLTKRMVANLQEMAALGQIDMAVGVAQEPR
jgi:hypothetical protein